MHWLMLVFWLLICFAVAGIGARWTVNEIPGWYLMLARPSFTPPDRVFGPVWTLLYLLMAIAVWRVGVEPSSPARTAAIALFVIQLALNLAWSWIFFHKHAIGAALAEIIVLWIAIGATTITFAQITSLAAWLMAPYWAWVSFASVLNGALWKLNSRRE